MLNSWIKHRPLIGATTRHGQAGCLASDAVVLPVSNAQIRLAYNDDELKQAARLRAEAYYEVGAYLLYILIEVHHPPTLNSHPS